MTTSDEITSLSEQVKKLTSTITKLILARSSHGMPFGDANIFDKLSHGLPRNMKMEQIAEFALTSKVILSYKIDFLNSFHDQLMKGLWKRSSNGCRYPLDNCYEKILYVEINEDYKVDSEKLMEELRNFSVTHQVFDEMSEPVLCSNESQIVSSEDNNSLKSDFHHNDEKEIEDEQTHGHVNEGMQLDGMRLAHNHHSVDEFHEFRRKSGDVVHECTEDVMEMEIQRPNAQKMLDELPLPTFIKEMAKTAKKVERNSICGDYEPALIVHEVQADLFAHLQQPEALDASYSHDLVFTSANRERFSMLPSLISRSCPHLDQTLKDYGEFYNGNIYWECPYVQVTVNPSHSFAETKSDVLDMGTLNINYDDLVWNVKSEPICFYQFVFDPGVLLRCVSNSEIFPDSKAFELEIELKSNMHYKEVQSWEKLEVELDALAWMNNLVNTFQPTFHNFVSCLHFSAIKTQIVRVIAFNNHAYMGMVSIHLGTLNYGDNNYEYAHLTIVHYIDLQPGVLNVIHLRHGLELLSRILICSVLNYDRGAYMSKNRMSEQFRLFDPGILASDTSILFFTYTLEVKGNFEEVGNDSVGRLMFLVAIEIYTEGYVPSQRSECKSHSIQVSVCVNVRLITYKTRMAYLTLFEVKGDFIGEGIIHTQYSWEFKSDARNFVWDNGYNYEVPGQFCWVMVVYSEYVMVDLLEVMKDKLHTFIYLLDHEFFWLNFQDATDASHMKVDLPSYNLYKSKDVMLILEALLHTGICHFMGKKQWAAPIWIFDPGGNIDYLIGETWGTRRVAYKEARAEVMLKWEAGVSLKYDTHNQNFSIYVFDPGIVCSKLRRLTGLLCFFKPPVSSKVVKCLNHCHGIVWVPLQMILAKFTLEVKGDLKGWELIHTQNIWEGRLVIYSFDYLFPKSIIGYIRV